MQPPITILIACGYDLGRLHGAGDAAGAGDAWGSRSRLVLVIVWPWLAHFSSDLNRPSALSRGPASSIQDGVKEITPIWIYLSRIRVQTSTHAASASRTCPDPSPSCMSAGTPSKPNSGQTIFGAELRALAFAMLGHAKKHQISGPIPT